MVNWIDSTIEEIKRYLPQLDVERVRLAYAVAEAFYEKKKTKIVSIGEGKSDFTISPHEIVDELKHFRPDEDTVIAALLYDAVDGGYADISHFDEHFGGEIKDLLEGVRILKSIRVTDDRAADKLDLFRKLFMVMARDIRVLVVFLAAKVVQMKELDSFPEEYQKRFATDVLEVFVPIASRLGVYRFKVLLEDLAFRYLYPAEFERMRNEMRKFGERRREYVEKVSEILERFYKEKGFEDVKVSGRLKGLYSSYNKIKRKGLDSLDDLYDVFAVRVVIRTEDVSKLYEALGHLHSQWRPIPARFKDYIAVPKPNGYRSLHTAVLGIFGGIQTYPVEVQIRSHLMHEEAEYGVASHWLYKEGKNKAGSSYYSDWVGRLSSLHKEMDTDLSVLESMHTDIFSDHIYVLTPRGDIKDLPAEATPLDFAYAIHTDVGHCCVLAKVNGKVVPLDSELSTGDTVEIVTRKDSMPKLEWINIVKTSGAKSKIRGYFAAQDDQKHIKLGREQLNRVLSRFGKPLLDPSLSILKEFGGKKLNSEERENLLREVGKGTQSASGIVRKIYSHEQLLEGVQVRRLPSKKDVNAGAGTPAGVPIEENILVSGMKGVALKIAGCCTPGYADDIVGYVSSKALVTVHRHDCKLLKHLNKDRFVSVQFKYTSREVHRPLRLYRIKIRIEAVRRIGILGDIGSSIATHGVNISSHSLSSADTTEKVAVISMVLDVYDLDQFEKVLNSIEKVDGVIKVIKE